MINPHQASSASDVELVKLSLSDQDNFLYLVNRYQGRLLSYIRRLTNIKPEDAEDILQEVFIKVYLNLNDFKEDLKFSSWIYRIAHNQVISNYRKLKARPEGYLLPLEDWATANLAAELDIAADLDKRLLRENIMKVLAALDVKYREILILKFLEEKSYQEISDILRKPAGTIASLIFKAKEEFRREMRGQGNIVQEDQERLAGAKN